MSREMLDLLAAVGLGTILTGAFIFWVYIAAALVALWYREIEWLRQEFAAASWSMVIFYVVCLLIWLGGGLYLGVKYIPGMFGV